MMSSDQQPEEEQQKGGAGKGAGSLKQGAKKSFVLRMDEQTYKAIERWAADEFRSVNGQLEWIIDQALRAGGRAKPAKKGEAGPPEGK